MADVRRPSWLLWALSRVKAGDAEITDLEQADPRWLTAVIRAEVKRRLRAWREQRIGTEDEDDLVNDVLIALWKNNRAELRRFDPQQGKAISFLRSFTKKRIIELERKELRRKDIDEAQPNALVPSAVLHSPDAWLAYFETRDSLIAALRGKKSSDEDLKIFFHAFVEDLTNGEIATLLNLSDSHVADRKCAIRRWVREHLQLGEPRK